MPRRSSVYTLDESVRAELDRRIVAAGFGRYAEHAAWLAGQGYAIGESAIQRYGKRLRHRRAIASTHPKPPSSHTRRNTMSERRNAKARAPKEIGWDIGHAVHQISALADHCEDFAGQLQVVGNEDRQEAAHEERNAVSAMQAGIAALANEALRDIEALDRHLMKDG